MIRLRRAPVLVGLTLAAVSGSAYGAPSGAVFTTTADGSAVNANHYAASTDVYLNGGPPCQASRRSAALPDGWYAFKVTDPSGRTDMTAGEAVADRFFRVAAGAVAESADSADHPVRTTACGAVMRVGSFAADSSNGEYKLHVVPATPGTTPVFAPNRTKTDNFQLDRGAAPPPDGGTTTDVTPPPPPPPPDGGTSTDVTPPPPPPPPPDGVTSTDVTPPPPPPPDGGTTTDVTPPPPPPDGGTTTGDVPPPPPPPPDDPGVFVFSTSSEAFTVVARSVSSFAASTTPVTTRTSVNGANRTATPTKARASAKRTTRTKRVAIARRALR